MKTLILLILFTVSISAQSWWFLMDDDTQAPSVVTSPSAVGDVNKVTLTWTDPTESDFDSVRIYAGTTANPTTWVASVAKGVQSYKDSNYSYNTIRHYRIKSKDRSGNLSAYTSSVNDTVMIWLGSELVTNGTFDADANWAKNGSTISGGKANIISVDGTLSLIFQSVACTSGYTYRCTFDVVRTSGTLIAYYNVEGNVTLSNTIATSGSYSYSFTAATTGSALAFKRLWICDINIDNVSLKRILNP